MEVKHFSEEFQSDTITQTGKAQPLRHTPNLSTLQTALTPYHALQQMHYFSSVPWSLIHPKLFIEIMLHSWLRS